MGFSTWSMAFRCTSGWTRSRHRAGHAVARVDHRAHRVCRARVRLQGGGVIEIRSAPAGDHGVEPRHGGLGTSRRDRQEEVREGRWAWVRRGIPAAALGSERFLDPLHPDNLHNTGHQGSSPVRSRRPGGRDRAAVGWAVGRAHIDVPNTEQQELAGQDQRQQLAQRRSPLRGSGCGRTDGEPAIGCYARRSGSALDGSERDMPLFASADRSLAPAGLLARRRTSRRASGERRHRGAGLSLDRSVHVRGDRARKAGGGAERRALARAENPFGSTGRTRPWLCSVYVQDTWQANGG